MLEVFPVARTSCKRVALSKRSGKLVRLPRFWPSVIAVMLMGGGRGLARPRDKLVMAELVSDSFEFSGGGDTILRGKSVGGVFRPMERGLTREGEAGEKIEDSV